MFTQACVSPGQPLWKTLAGRLPLCRRLLLSSSSRPPGVFFTWSPSGTGWALQLSAHPLAAADSPLCHWVKGVIYLFMSPDVSSPATAG